MNAIALLCRLIVLVLSFALSIGAAHAAETVTYFHADALGTPVMESNASGTVTYSREHLPYGEQMLGTAKQGPGFTGHIADLETGMVYMQARFYDPVAGRFIASDPLLPGIDGGENFNRYWYAKNSPLSYIDPDGWQTKRINADDTEDDKARARAERDAQSMGGGLDQNRTSRAYVDAYFVSALSGDWKGALSNGLNMIGATWKEAFATPGDGMLTIASTFPVVGLEAAAAKSSANVARSSVSMLKLEKSLASAAQMGEVGTIIAGQGARVQFRDAARFAKQYGGESADWVKKSSSSYLARDGQRFETHWVEHVPTGYRVEFKTKIGE